MPFDVEVVIPTFNPTTELCNVVASVSARLRAESLTHAIWLVDDGSSSESRSAINAAAQQDYVGVIRLAFNAGQASATLAGLRATTAPVVLCCDDDGESDLGQLSAIVHAVYRGADAAFVSKKFARRLSVRGVGSRANRWIQLRQFPNVSWEASIQHAGLSTPWGIRRDVADLVCSTQTSRPYIAGLVFSACQNVAIISASSHASIGSKTRYSVAKRYRLWSNAVFSHTALPMRVIAIAALGFAALSVGTFAYVAWITHSTRVAVPGYLSLLGGILLSSALILSALGVLTSYLARMYEVVVGKPPYVIASIEADRLHKGHEE